MPPIPTAPGPPDRAALLAPGRVRVAAFCRLNGVPAPAVTVVPRERWPFEPCAYYRPNTPANRERLPRLGGHRPGVNVCPEKCQVPCGPAPSRNWSWPGSVTDRTPYGVLAHELGHHCDWLMGERRWSYGSEYSEEVMDASGEPPVTSYAPNPAEWFAEVFRVFVTNPGLLRALRPRAYAVLTHRWRPLGPLDWGEVLGPACPPRVVRALENKIREVCQRG